MILYAISLGIFFLVSLVLLLIILVQEGKSSGLGSFLGGDSRDSLFGTSTPEVLRQVTVGLSIAFVALSLFMSFWTSHLGREQHYHPQVLLESLEQPPTHS